ncbi:hypothetical protein F5Y09DRAFT_320366 [Xylaria sp. FL1042]|nr:hypothetical protein F5Y09DRAFT_320366 [Xylaria sp. FL1042]
MVLFLFYFLLDFNLLQLPFPFSIPIPNLLLSSDNHMTKKLTYTPNSFLHLIYNHYKTSDHLHSSNTQYSPGPFSVHSR